MALGKLVVKDKEGHIVAGSLEGLIAEVIKVTFGKHYQIKIKFIYTPHISNRFRGVYNKTINVKIKFRKLQSFISLDKV